MPSEPVIYEVALDVQADIATDFDAWLQTHMHEMLGIEGFLDARIWRAEQDPHAGVVRRVVHYTVDSRESLERYFREHAERMREDGLERFGDRFSASRRTLEINPALPAPTVEVRSLCPNCGHLRSGKYCSNCGQDTKKHVISLWHLIHDYLEDFFNFDSRFFRSLKPLLLRPGFLTSEYLRGRRASYIPPVRLYVFSFVVCAALLSITGVHSNAFMQFDNDKAPQTMQDNAKQSAEAANDMVKVTGVSSPTLRDFIAKRIERMRKDPKEFSRALQKNVPLMLVLSLPLLALFNKLLFWRHYFVEHMVFYLHYHTFAVIDATLAMLIERAWKFFMPADIVWQQLISALLWIYLVAYLFMAIRRHYHQGRFMTTLKMFFLSFVYIFSLAITGLIVFTFTVATF